MIGAVLAVVRAVRLRLWAAGARLRLRRVGMRLEVSFGPGVRFETLPRIEVDPWTTARGGSLRLDVGARARLGRELVLEVLPGTDSTIVVGPGSVFRSWCRLQAQGGALEMGEAVEVRDLAHVKWSARLVLGERATVGRGATVQAAAGVEIGAGTVLAERSSVVDSDHVLDGSGERVLAAPVSAKPVFVGRGVFAGANSVVLQGSRLGDGAVLGAGAVLNGNEVPAGGLAVGVPARVVRDLRSGVV